MKGSLRTGLLITSILLSAVLGIAQTQQSGVRTKNKSTSRISTKYEKSKDQTVVRLKQFTITRLEQEKQIANIIPLHQMDLEISFAYEGQELRNPVSDVTFRFHCVAGNYVFLRGQNVIAALDVETPGRDRAIPFGMTDYKSMAPKFNSVYEEFMTVAVPAQALQKIAKADSLKFYVGPVMYNLTNEQIGDIRELSEWLIPQRAPTNDGN